MKDFTMYILEHYGYEVNEYDSTTPLCVSDSVEKLKAYAATLPQWDEVYDQQWVSTESGMLVLEYITDYFTDLNQVCRTEGFSITPIQTV